MGERRGQWVTGCACTGVCLWSFGFCTFPHLPFLTAVHAAIGLLEGMDIMPRPTFYLSLSANRLVNSAK